MLRAALLSLVLATAVLFPALAVQVPLSSANRQQAQYHQLNDEEWNLSKQPNPNSTDHLVFETVYSLLQHWPNTRMRNGHNIVPGNIPKGTLFYHVRMDKELPPGPEWVATDPEHSYAFCEPFPPLLQKECWQLTVATTRALKVVYFDGSSAAKLPNGPMDTQDLVAWGKAHNHSVYDEMRRIQDLCNWGKNFGVDGFVRMEMDFEVMLCDFTSGVSVVSFVNLVRRQDMEPFIPDLVEFEVMNAGSWHNHFPGETRVQLDLTGLISFYDTQLAPSLVSVRARQERWDHRARNISSKDLSVAKSRLEAILMRPQGVSSGIDWRTLIQVIVDRYAGRLELAHYHMGFPVTSPDDILDLANKVQYQLRIMLTPYLFLSAIPTDLSDKVDLDWTIPIFKLCATSHTSTMDSDLDSMTDSEKLLLRAVRGTTREICRVVTKMWAAGVHAGIDPLLNRKDSPDVAKVTRVWNIWAKDLDHLMSWLDWNVWIKCNPRCSFEEMCYLPTWPVGFPPIQRYPPFPPPDSDGPCAEGLTSVDFQSTATERLAEQASHVIRPERDEWIRPQPKCIRRVAPYGF